MHFNINTDTPNWSSVRLEEPEESVSVLLPDGTKLEIDSHGIVQVYADELANITGEDYPLRFDVMREARKDARKQARDKARVLLGRSS